MSKDYHERANEWLTPAPKEQTARILEGKCPHNQGWIFECHCHNDSAYRCKLCGKTEFY